MNGRRPPDRGAVPSMQLIISKCKKQNNKR
nr:MAG TPA: hypothetical protein [Caudoviricetes sp.]DAR65769.1 MAG TPA: hypothetical protein [Caudoviricetes sp.]